MILKENPFYYLACLKFDVKFPHFYLTLGRWVDDSIHFYHNVKHGSARPQLHNIYRRLLPLELSWLQFLLKSIYIILSAKCTFANSKIWCRSNSNPVWCNWGKVYWTFPLSDKILKNIEIGKNITMAWKSIPSLLKLRSLVVKCCKL